MSVSGSGVLWEARDFLAAVGGRADGPALGGIVGISMDSRTIATGEAFFAIVGENHDGHAFVADALARGAAIAVVAETFSRGEARHSLVFVDEPLAAMQRLAEAARHRTGAPIVAITGSVGKTGTKQALALALGATGPTHASPASFNNHWGVPFSLANMPADSAFGVFELGMNHAGEIGPLARMVRPDVAIITTVEPVHIGHLGSIEAIADAKAEIFEGLEAGGAAILNRDNGQFDRLARAAECQGARVVRFGEGDDAEARLMSAVPDQGGSAVEADILGHRITYRIGGPGRHLAMNSLAVLAAVVVVGADLERGAAALADWRPGAGRGARLGLRLDGGEVTLIDESYNANPASMRAALALLGDAEPGSGGRRIAVLGDMLELGDQGPALHRDLAKPIAAARTDLVFVCGPLMCALWEALPAKVRGAYGSASDELEQPLANALRPGDVVMIKGSLGSRMRPLVEALMRRSQAVSRAGGN